MLAQKDSVVKEGRPLHLDEDLARCRKNQPPSATKAARQESLHRTTQWLFGIDLMNLVTGSR